MKTIFLFLGIIICNTLSFAQIKNKPKTKLNNLRALAPGNNAIKAAPRDTSNKPIKNATISDTSILRIIEQLKPDTLAQFYGGTEAYIKFLNNYLIYPQAALEKNIQGRVYVRFIVCEDGSICNVKVMDNKSVDDVHLRNEAIRIVKKTPKWKPAMLKGQAIKTYYELPINFTLVE